MSWTRTGATEWPPVRRFGRKGGGLASTLSTRKRTICRSTRQVNSVLNLYERVHLCLVTIAASHSCAGGTGRSSVGKASHPLAGFSW
jgi:hypothetical protein